MDEKSHILIITGSTRPGRVGGHVGEWVFKQAQLNDGIEVSYADLAELNLPLSTEPNFPKTGNYTQEQTKEWASIIDQADGFILVTPEYNHGYPASVKNALDYLYKEWNHKPIAFVGYGAASSGSRAIEQLKQVVLELEMLPIHAQVMFHLDFASGNVLAGMEQTAPALAATIAELSAWAVRAKEVRASLSAKVS